MRIIEGKYRKLPLQSTPSPRVRPTARRLRETLFDFLGARIVGARFLDLCAGSGAVGMEALSRGASFVTFVDRSAKMCAMIEANLKRCEIATDCAEVVTGDARDFLQWARASAPLVWDIAFFDPPYAADYASVLSFFATGAALKRKKGVLVVEHHCENTLRNEIGSLRRWRIVRQGQSCLSFYESK